MISVSVVDIEAIQALTRHIVREAALIAALKRTGAIMRGVARRVLRRRKGKSPPGQPPAVHTANQRVTLKNIIFRVDPRGYAVAIAPVVFGRSINNVPDLHEYGGVTVRRAQFVFAPTKRRKRQRIITSFRAQYPPRPYMGPAYEQAESQLPVIWQRAIQRRG